MAIPSIVRDLARRGHSMTAAAQILGVQRDDFIAECRESGWEELFCNPMQSVARKESARRRKGRWPEPMSVTYQGVTDTLAGHARRLGLPWSTVYSRHLRRPDDLEYVFARRNLRKTTGETT